VTVRIDEAVGGHDAEVLRLSEGCADCVEGPADEAVDLRADFATGRRQHLHGRARAADLFRGETGKRAWVTGIGWIVSPIWKHTPAPPLNCRWGKKPGAAKIALDRERAETRRPMNILLLTNALSCCWWR
jgi:hypothetical protein